MSAQIIAMTRPNPFDEFWSCIQPERRRDRLRCRIIFNRIISESGFQTGVQIGPNEWEPVKLQATPDQIIAGWRRYSAQFLKPDARWCPVEQQRFVDGGRYVKLPINWLKEEGWADQP